MRPLVRVLLLVALSATGLAGSLAQAVSLEELAQPLFPNTKIDAVEPTPVPGLYEVRAGRSILYMDKTGRYVVVGELYDFPGRRNLTAERLLNLNAVRFEDLPLDKAVRLGSDHGTRRLAIFDDVDCPYCQRFHREVLPALLKDGTTVYVFLYPLASLHPDAEAKSAAVWCSPDRAAAIEAIFQDGTVPAAGAPLRPKRAETSSTEGQRSTATQDVSRGVKGPQRGTTRCETPLAEIRTLGRRLGVTGTPTLILDTGAIVEGYITYEALQAKWQDTRKRR